MLGTTSFILFNHKRPSKRVIPFLNFEDNEESFLNKLCVLFFLFKKFGKKDKYRISRRSEFSNIMLSLIQQRTR